MMSTYTYDASNNQTGVLYQNWNDGVWVNSNQETFTFDANNFTISNSYITWNTAGTEVTSGDSTHYYFKTVLGLNDLSEPIGNITVYPNPASTNITISMPTTPQKNTTLIIIDITGKEVLKCELTKDKKVVDISALVQGLYILRVADDRTVMVSKLVKQ
jgi:hypothetical protein